MKKLTLAIVTLLWTITRLNAPVWATEQNNKDESSIEMQLIKAASDGDLSCIESLLTKSANINATDNNGATALINAASYGYVTIVETLVNAGAAHNLADNRGYTALMWAAVRGHATTVKALI